MLRHLSEIRNSGKTSSLAISGQCCSGKSTLCKILSGKLGWLHVDVGGEIRKLAREQGLQIEKFGLIPERSLLGIDALIKQQIIAYENRIWDGRLSCYLSRDNPRIFKAYCKAPFEVRIERCAIRDKLSLKEARKKIVIREKEETSVFKKLYDLSSPYSAGWVNLCLDTSLNTPQKLSERVIRAIAKIPNQGCITH